MSVIADVDLPTFIEGQRKFNEQQNVRKQVKEVMKGMLERVEEKQKRIEEEDFDKMIKEFRNEAKKRTIPQLTARFEELKMDPSIEFKVIERVEMQVILQELAKRGVIITAGVVGGGAILGGGVLAGVGINKAVQDSKNSKRTETRNGIVNK